MIVVRRHEKHEKNKKKKKNCFLSVSRRLYVCKRRAK